MKKLLFVYLMTWAVVATTVGQQYHKNIQLDSTDAKVPDKIWSPLARYGQNVGVTGRNWNEPTTHVGRESYAVDINAREWVAGVWESREDLWTPVYLPISGNVWVVAGFNGGFGNTALIWDKDNSKVVRLAHLVAFAAGSKDWTQGNWHSAGELAPSRVPLLPGCTGGVSRACGINPRLLYFIPPGCSQRFPPPPLISVFAK